MYTLAAGEKATLVLVYTETMLLRGEVITTENIRVNTWLRTAGVPEYMHILKPQILFFGCGGVKSYSYGEIYLPTATITAFHPVNPADNPPDYAEDEPNRVMIPITAMAGTFLCKGKLRISTLSGLSMSIEQSHASWTSIYEAELTNPYLAQMPAMRVPLILVRPTRVPLALEAD